MKLPLHLAVCWSLVVLCAGGCRLLTNNEPVVQGQSPLRAGRPSPDSVMMEII